MLRNTNVNPKNGVAYEKCVSPKEPKFSGALPQTPLGPFRASPQTLLLQSSEIPNLGLMGQTGNFWLTPWEFLIILLCKLQQKYFDLNLKNKFLKSLDLMSFT